MGFIFVLSVTCRKFREIELKRGRGIGCMVFIKNERRECSLGLVFLSIR